MQASAGKNITDAAQLAPGVVASSEILNDSIINEDIKSDAAIGYAKLNLTGGIVNADINASAAIVDTKLAAISTAGKVSGAALTSLASVPAGAGVLPAANAPAASAYASLKPFGATPLNRYLTAPTTNGSLSTVSAGNGLMIFTPFFVAGSITLDQFAINVDTAVNPSTTRCGIYTDVAGYPTTLVVESGAITTNTTGVKTASINQVLTAGVYWLATSASDNVVLLGGVIAQLGLLGWPDTLTSVPSNTWEADFTYGSFPSTAPTTNRAVGNRGAGCFVRRSA